MTFEIRNVSIVGCGQIGTSILLALAEQGKVFSTTVFDAATETEALVRQRFGAEGLNSSLISFKPTIAEAVSSADLIILATPMSVFEQAAREIGQHAPDGSILTDTGSAKKVAIQKIMSGLSRSGLSYVPAHPGNGSHGSGPLTGSAGNILGPNSTMFLIDDRAETGHDSDSALLTVENFWSRAGVNTARMSTEKHDRFFGQCSHYQHALVFSLMGVAKGNPGVVHNFQHAGTALRNLSRVAISELQEGGFSTLARMWEPIFDQNKGPILEAHMGFLRHFDTFVDFVNTRRFDDLTDRLKTAREFRLSFREAEPRETIAGEIADLEGIEVFNPQEPGALCAAFDREALPALATNMLLPLALSYAQTMSAQDIDPLLIAEKANPSFRDGTHPSTYDPAYVRRLFESRQAGFLKLANIFRREIETLIQMILSENQMGIRGCILNAQMIRNAMPPPRKGDAVRLEFTV